MKKSLISLLGFMLFGASIASAQEKISFPMSASSNTLGYSPVWMTWKQGFFAKQGLGVGANLVCGADKSVMALVGGSTNVAAKRMQSKGPLPSPAQFIDRSYLQETLNELES